MESQAAMSQKQSKIAIIGAGLAGSEAALFLARAGVSVDLYEMRPGKTSPAHKTDFPAELVCSNSLKSDQLPGAHGILKAELALLKSPLLAIAETCRVPAGSALAVDRDLFGRAVLAAIEAEPNIRLIREECLEPPAESEYCIVAAGPLASEGITEWLQARFSATALNFYDAIAPVVSAESIDMNIAFRAARWEGRDSEGDYINCPFSPEEYKAFYEALIDADEVVAREFEKASFFEGCLPIEVMARRGFEVLAFGTMRPVGLVDPRTGFRPYAICQLRREDAAGDSWNIVGFQTRLRIPEQQRVFRLIPGLASAEFLRYGTIHRNTYLDSPRILSADLSFKDDPTRFLAGQICGNEGYTESITTGHCVARAVLAKIAGNRFVPPPTTTACGALLFKVTHGPEKGAFQPINVNFSIFEPYPVPEGKKKIPKDRKQILMAERALKDMKDWIGAGGPV